MRALGLAAGDKSRRRRDDLAGADGLALGLVGSADDARARGVVERARPPSLSIIFNAPTELPMAVSGWLELVRQWPR